VDSVRQGLNSRCVQLPSTWWSRGLCAWKERRLVGWLGRPNSLAYI